jgi:hypothetical protein
MAGPAWLWAGRPGLGPALPASQLAGPVVAQHRRILTIDSAGAQITHICRHHRWRYQAPAADQP